MPTARPTLAAEPRDTTGKAVNRLRKNGRLPGVVYGRDVASSNVSLDAHEFEQLRRHTTANTLIDLSVDGGRKRPVLVHGVQVHPVTRRPLHVDLFVVRMTEELTVDVPLIPTGSSRAVDELGGTLLHLAESVKVKALPDHLPETIEYTIEPLVDFETTLHVRDLPIPDDVTLLNDPDEAVAKVQQPRVEIEEAPAAEAEAAEAPEGEAGTGEAAASATESGESGSAEG